MRLQKKLADLILSLRTSEFPPCRSTIRREDFPSKLTDRWICDWTRRKASAQQSAWITFPRKNSPECFTKIQMSHTAKSWRKQLQMRFAEAIASIQQQSLEMWSRRLWISFRIIKKRRTLSRRLAREHSRHFVLMSIMNSKCCMNSWRNSREH